MKTLRLGVLILLIGASLCCEKHEFKPAPKTDPLVFASASELTDLIRRGELASLHLLNLYLDHIERYNGDVNAVVALDVEGARSRAAKADEALAQGRDWGPLHGLPMTVKDVFRVADMPATSGDRELKNYIPKRNATAVQRLVDAGAIVFGKTNVPYHALDAQTYNKVYGTTNNPWDLSRTPGGSSGGSAAALAAGFTPLELGSDLGGSIRLPAHYTGVFGHKTSFGVVPRYGHIPPKPGEVRKDRMGELPLFVLGPLARSADDLELALEVLTTPGNADQNDQRPDLLPPRRQRFVDYRVAVWFTGSSPAAEIDSGVLERLQKTVEKLRDAGLQVDEGVHPDVHLQGDLHLLWEIAERMMTGALPLSEELVERQTRQQQKWSRFFERYDVLLAPVSPTVAFPHDHKLPMVDRQIVVNGKGRPYADIATWTASAIVSGLPATVAPVGLSESGLPVGVQIIGARFEDRTTIAFARGLSELVGGFVAPPGYMD